MSSTRAHFIAATRKAAIIASGVVGLASGAAAQTSYELSIPILWTSGNGLGTAQVISTPAGIDCRSESSGSVLSVGTCSAEFPAGTPVTLSATPLYGGTFDGWVGACDGQGATCHLTMTAPLTTSPKTIAKMYTLTVRGTGNATATIFNNDHLANPRLACGITPGGQTSGTCVTEYPANQQVWLRRDIAVTSPARFVGYTGCGDNPDPNDCRFIIEGPTIVTAGWVAPEIIVGSGGGEGTGTVTGVISGSSVSVLDCAIAQTAATGTCTHTWDRGPPPNSVTLIATPNGNSVFQVWSGTCSGTGPCVISLQGRPDSLKVSARFGVPLSPLTVTSAGSGNGRITSDPAGVDCFVTAGSTAHNCSGLFAPGTAVTLTADPTGSSTFGGWNGACSGPQLTCTLTATAATQVTARFVAPRPAGELALALLGRLTITADEQRQLDRFGNTDDVFDLGDLLALLARTGERLPTATMSVLLAAQRVDPASRPARRNK